MVKIFTKICTAIFGLWAITRCVLDYWSYFETGKSVFDNRGEFLKTIGPILGSQWLPLVLFLSGVALLILLEIVSRKTDSEEAKRLHAFLVKVRDLVVLPGETMQASERFDVMGALIYFCGDLENEKQTVKGCSELELCGFEHSFKVLENGFPGIFKGHWLQFLRDARKYKTEIRRLTAAIAFARKEWRYSDKFTKAQSKFYGWRTSNSSLIATNSIPGNRITDEAGQAIYDKAARAIRNGAYPLLALQEAGAHTFSTNEDLVDLCLDLEKNIKVEPFAIFKGIFNQDSWLAILQDARRRGIELQSDYAALEWAAEWNQDTLAGKTSPIERRIEVKMLAGRRQVEVCVINRDQEKPARLQSIRIYRIKDGKETDVGLDGSAVMEALSKPCVLSPEERRVFTTRLVVASLVVYGASGYFAEVELEVGPRVRSNVYKVEKSVE